MRALGVPAWPGEALLGGMAGPTTGGQAGVLWCREVTVRKRRRLKAGCQRGALSVMERRSMGNGKDWGALTCSIGVLSSSVLAPRLPGDTKTCRETRWRQRGGERDGIGPKNLACTHQTPFFFQSWRGPRSPGCQHPLCYHPTDTILFPGVCCNPPDPIPQNYRQNPGVLAASSTH